VPGANDGASGVAVMLEMARVLPQNGVPVWLVFFDAEDNGRLESWDWILGSRAFAEALTFEPQAVVIVDMIGDKDLKIFQEGFSDRTITEAIWAQAAALGHADVFVPEVRHNILDDHVPFLEKGIPAVDIIDIDYAYWHTTQDTADKVAPESLQIVGDTLLAWLATLTR
jgi:Zn-dependent M28 family amino/carboxypeptidase